MEFEKLFATIAVVCIGAIAIMGWISYENSQYGTSVSAGFNSTMHNVQSMGINNISSFGNEFGASIVPTEGNVTGSDCTGLSCLASIALDTIKIIPKIMGMPISLLRDAAIIVGIPSAYVSIAVAVFVFSFVILFAYLLLLGVKRLI